MKILNCLILVLIVICKGYSQPVIQWQKCFGGSNDDVSFTMQQTSDSGYIMAGRSNSNDGIVTGNHGDFDYWIVKMDFNSNLEWEKSLGGSGFDVASSIIHTNDNGYIVVGSSNSVDGDVLNNYGIFDIWVVKLDSTGSILWQKNFGGSGFEHANSIESTPDGGYLIAGYTSSSDGDVSLHRGGTDFWVLKINNLGDLQWEKTYGGTNSEYANKIALTSDGGFIIAGTSNSNDMDVSINQGMFDYWIIKIDSIGTLQWEKSYGGSYEEEVKDIQQTLDGGYILAGTTNSIDGDINYNYGGVDMWILKLDSTGAIEWNNTYGGSSYDRGSSVITTNDGGYLVIGSTGSTDGNVNCLQVGIDIWWIKLDHLGNIEWQKCLGGSNEEGSTSGQITADGNYIIGGYTNSNNGDVSGNYGNYDFWIIKLSGPNTTSENNIGKYNLFIFPNPTKEEINISFTLESNKEIKLELYNSLGQIAKSINKRKLPAGKNEINFSVAELPVGVYHLKFSAGDEVVVKRVVKM